MKWYIGIWEAGTRLASHCALIYITVALKFKFMFFFFFLFEKIVERNKFEKIVHYIGENLSRKEHLIML